MTLVRRVATLLLIALVLLGPSGLVAHHHTDQEDEHCVVCLLLVSLLATLPLLTSVPQALRLSFRLKLVACPIAPGCRQPLPSPRAPPA